MQGFNMGRYRAPEDLDTSMSTAPSKKQRLTPAQPTVRFEMPFAIWCTACPSKSTNALIGQGVRFNAVKKKVGNYFSTPVWSFRMKHTPCSSWIEIRTDPANHGFDVTEGAKRRDYGDDATVAERTDAAVLSRVGPGGASADEERKRQDAFEAFEGKAAEKIKTKNDSARIDELRVAKERDWRDPDSVNKKLRDAFRTGRRERQAESKKKEEVSERYGLGLELLDFNDTDARRAALVEFGRTEAAGRRPFLSSAAAVPQMQGVSGKAATLHQELASNTRAAKNPFNDSGESGAGFRLDVGIKRKLGSPPVKSAEQQNPAEPMDDSKTFQESRSNLLVDYDSD